MMLANKMGVLMDVGEGSFGQLLRIYGSENILGYLENLKLIFISHMHADHHLGTIRVLQEWSKLNLNKGITIIGPTKMWMFLNEYSKCQDLKLSKHLFVPCHSAKGLNQGWMNELKLTGLEAVAVDHCPDSYGLVMNIDSKHCLVYSGDTR